MTTASNKQPTNLNDLPLYPFLGTGVVLLKRDKGGVNKEGLKPESFFAL